MYITILNKNRGESNFDFWPFNVFYTVYKVYTEVQWMNTCVRSSHISFLNKYTRFTCKSATRQGIPL